MPDIFQFVDDLDGDAQQRVVDRLEFRGNYAPFVAMRDAYLARVRLPPEARVCELGCGTGVVSRAIGAMDGFDGTVLGTDVSEVLVAEATRRAAQDGLDSVSFRADRTGGTGEPDASCDLVILHTLISHVADTDPVLSEAARIARPGASIVVFDGDYASLTCHCGRPAEDESVIASLLQAIVANPHVMRDMPRLLQARGLVVSDVSGDVLLEAGEADFFGSLVDSYVPIAVRAGALGEAEAAAWLERFRDASAERRFFGSCNFVTYLAEAS